MKIAVIGKGKTGGKVAELLPADVVLGPFGRDPFPTHEELNAADCAIVFTPAEALENLVPLLLEVKTPVVWGVTGHSWPKDLDKTLKKKQLTWIHAANFSLGMVLIKKTLELFHHADRLMDDIQFSMKEVHHTKKVDAPSGTALAWAQWLGHDVGEIEAIREGDVKGIHELTVETPFERIIIHHESKDRALFAQGAIWAANKCIKKEVNEYGLLDFQALVEKELMK